MEKTAITLAILSSFLAGLARAGDYDFYSGVRYPVGGRLLPGVDLYKPVQTGTGRAKAYDRRTVDWWPRKGVDIIAPTDGMPLRDWTWRGAPPAGQAAAFKAHLVGFRGMGNTMSSKFRGDGGPIEPAVVLRLADGRKRCFLRGSFSDADKKYIMALYVKEMNRIEATLDKTPRVKRPSADVSFPNNAKPGEPGTMQVESERFIWLSGSQAGSDDDPWVNAIAPDKAQWYRDGSIECAKFWWALNEYAGHLMPYWDRTRQFKYEISVPGTKRDGHQVIPGYAGGGYGGCGIKGAGGGPWAGALFHEWGHGAQGNSWRVGGGEAQADMHQCLAAPTLKGNHHVKTPWRNIFNGSMGYGYTVFYNITGDDPNWGYAWFACVPAGAGEYSIMQIAARVGEQRGMFKNGIRGFGDMMGEYGARLATFDCELEDMFRKAYFAPARSWLEPVDRAKGVYRVPMEEAPEPYGVNIVRLVATENAPQIVVDFTGLHDPDFYSDWRACLVAVGADGKSRYSPMWSKGKMAMKRRAGDAGYWLTVSATPTAIYCDSPGSSLVQTVYSGRYAYRYPWSVSLSGCKPGTPRQSRADFGKAAGQQYSPHDSVPSLPDGATGGRHPNGGGWVARTATVAKTAYVGPDAMVLGQAKVLNQAVVEDYAIVTDRAVVSGRARISGQAIIKGAAQVGGYSRTWQTLESEAIATVVPTRLRAKTPNKDGLWANYAMDRDEKTVLVDWYRFAHGADRRYGNRLGVDLNGYLTGRPEFVVDGKRRGFRFDGKTQYGELCPRACDLGEMTVDLAVKWQGAGSQTILDLGSSADNCLVLRTGGSGKVELVATVEGKVIARVSSPKALAADKWVRLRIESDGKTLSLWIDGDKAASRATDFRPCDAFAPGAEKRNFLATARDGSKRFKGLLDYVVVYHGVSDDFSKVPAPIRDAPVRPTREFIAAIEKAYGNIAVVNEKISAGVSERSKPYEKLRLQKDARSRELLERSPAFLKAEADLEAVKRAMDKGKRQLADEFAKSAEAVRMQAKIDEMNKQLAALSTAVRKLESECFTADEELKSLTAQRNMADTLYRTREKERARHAAERKRCDTAIRGRQNALRDALRKDSPDVRRQEALRAKVSQLSRTLSGKRDVYAAKGTAALTKKLGQAETALAKANDEAMAPYGPEKFWMGSFQYQGYRGYYNTPYRSYLGQYVKALVGGGEMRESVGVLTSLEEALAGGKGWHTTVDWDWRMKPELDGSIKDMPLMQKWLVRVRGSGGE